MHDINQLTGAVLEPSGDHHLVDEFQDGVQRLAYSVVPLHLALAQRPGVHAGIVDIWNEMASLDWLKS